MPSNPVALVCAVSSSKPSATNPVHPEPTSTDKSAKKSTGAEGNSSE